MNNIHHSFRFHLVIVIIFAFSFPLLADDTGITKVRLIQQSDTSYVLEADVPQMLLNTIKTPVFPERFVLGNFEYNNQSGWITLKIQISTSGHGLIPGEEIVLPWDRNGVDFTVQWDDGSAFKGLFNRSIDGIHIPLNDVMIVRKTTREVVTESFILGLRHFSFRFIHILFIIVLIWSYPSFSALRLLLWFSFGKAISMIFTEIRIPGPDILFSDWLLLVLILSMTLIIAYKKVFRFIWIPLLLVGLIHGLSFSHELKVEPLSHIQKVQALFAFNLATDLCHYLSAFVFLQIIPKVKTVIGNNKFIPVSFGVSSVFLILLIFHENVQTGKSDILELPSSKINTIKQSVPKQTRKTQVRRASAGMSTPIMVYLSVNPYEVKQEILINAELALKAIDLENPSDHIPLDVQEMINSNINAAILEKNSLRINNLGVSPALTSVNFVRLSRGGVYIRETPREESTENAIIGITNIYDVSTFPDSITVLWNFFPDSVENIEATVVDPHGVFTTTINTENSHLIWTSRLPGYKPAGVEPVKIENYPIPIISIVLWIIIIILLLYFHFAKKSIQKKRIILSLILTGFILYPFVRFPSPVKSKWKPSMERTSIILHDLLSNVYRAFERREEEAVYDRLAMSITGDQLTQIYLENRQALALENRGGAKASVDEVNILNIYGITRTDDKAIRADVLWTVSGSVSHFGHTHYRKNQYRAHVTFSNENQTWKISNIDTIEEIRIL